MDLKILDQNVLITGAAGVLEQETTRVFAAEEAHVVLTARRPHAEVCIEITTELADNTMFVELDVGNNASWSAAVAGTEAQLGPIPALISNAAAVAVGGIKKTAIAEWRDVFDIDLTGDFLNIRAVAPSMHKLGSGSIMMISSITALRPTPNLLAYGCSNWGNHNSVATATYELPRDNIRVNLVHLGIIETSLVYDPGIGIALVSVDRLAIPRSADPAEVAKHGLLVVSSDAIFSTGSNIVADSGFGLGPIT